MVPILQEPLALVKDETFGLQSVRVFFILETVFNRLLGGEV